MDNSRPIIDQIKEMLIKQLNLDRTPESINEDTLLFKYPPIEGYTGASAEGQDSLNLDSIDSLEIIIGLEKYFGIKITDEDLKEPEKIFKNIGALTDFVKSRMNK